MKKFQVDVKETVIHTIQVDAEDEEEAKGLAFKKIEQGAGVEIDSAFAESNIFVEELTEEDDG